MPYLRLIYDCDHNVITRTYEVTTVSVTRGEGNIDKIPVNNVVRIGDVLSEDETIIFSPEIYNFYNGSIVWIGGHDPSIDSPYSPPKKGESYKVILKYMIATLTKYKESECRRCNGTNWYVTLLPEGSTLEYTSGPYLVAQEFIKALLTVPLSDRINPPYGSGLISNTGVMYLDNNLENNIKTAISTAEIQCKESSSSDPNRQLNEILDKVTIDSLTIDEENSGVYIFLTLLTVEGSRIRLSMKA